MCDQDAIKTRPRGDQCAKVARSGRGKSAGKALAGLGKALGKALALTFDDASELVVSQV